MRVGINTLLLSPSKAGIGNYIYYLLKNLYNVSDLDLTLFGQKEQLASVPQQVKVVSPSIKLNKSWQRILWEQTVLPWQSGSVDLMHYPDYGMPILFKSKPSIITVHDLSYFHYPQTFTKGSRLTKQLLSRPSVHRADKIITDSENTKRDLVNIFGLPEDKITVIYLGIDKEIFKPLSPEESRNYLINKYNLSEAYFLYVGTLEPRKNLSTLIRAYSQVKKILGTSCPKLVLGGGKGWLFEEIFASVEKLGLREDVVFPGYIPDADLVYFYNCAEIFVYPSLYEGFGLPPLEAMACGAPVITSNTSSLPEVVGEAGVMIDPHDADVLAREMVNIHTNPQLRGLLIKKGSVQAAKFEWSETARQTRAVYQEVYQKGRYNR